MHMGMFSTQGMFRALMKGKAKHGNSWLPKRRSRHLKSQMKFFGGPKYKKKSQDALWKFSTRPRDGWGKIFNP